MNYAESVHLMLSREQQQSRNFSGEQGLLRYIAIGWGTANGAIYDCYYGLPSQDVFTSTLSVKIKL